MPQTEKKKWTTAATYLEMASAEMASAVSLPPTVRISTSILSVLLGLFPSLPNPAALSASSIV